MFNPIQIVRRVTVQVGTAAGDLFEHTFRRGDVCHVEDSLQGTDEATFMELADLGSVELPNDAWRWKEVTERDVCEHACKLRAEGVCLKPLAVTLGLFAEVWNDPRFDNLGRVMGFFAFDQGTIKKYRRRARRAGYQLRKMPGQEPIDVEGLNDVIRRMRPSKN